MSTTEALLDLYRATDPEDQRLPGLLSQQHRALTDCLAQLRIEQSPSLSVEVAAVERWADSYRQALWEIGTCIEHRDGFRLAAVAGSLEVAADGLRSARQRHEEALLALGPSPYPLVNFYANLARHIESGRKSADLWPLACRRHARYFQNGRPDIVDILERMADTMDRSLLEDLSNRLAVLQGPAMPPHVARYLALASEHDEPATPGDSLSAGLALLGALQGLSEGLQMLEATVAAVSTEADGTEVQAFLHELATELAPCHDTPTRLRDAQAQLAEVHAALSEGAPMMWDGPSPLVEALQAFEQQARADLLEGLAACDEAALLLHHGAAAEEVAHRYYQGVHRLLGVVRALTAFGKLQC